MKQKKTCLKPVELLKTYFKARAVVSDKITFEFENLKVKIEFHFQTFELEKRSSVSIRIYFLSLSIN